MNKRLLQDALLIILASGLAACAAKSAFKRGENEAKRGNWDAAVVHYTRATRENPDAIEYRMALRRALMESSKVHLEQGRKRLAAEDLEGAIEELELATQLDPTNELAESQLAEAREELKQRQELRHEVSEFEQRRARARELLATQPVLEPSSNAPINLKFAQDTSLKKIFEVLSKLSGVNILFDQQFRDQRVTIDLVDVTFREALDKLVLINRLFYKVVDPSTIIIIPDNAQKHRQYDDLSLKTFYVVNAEVNTVANMLRTIAGIQRVQPNPELKSITVRATPDQIAVAERIVELNDKSKSEIIIDIEILEVDRNKLLDYGLRLSEYEVQAAFDPAGTDDAGRLRLNRLAAVDTSDFLIRFPSSAFYRLFKDVAEVKLLSSPKLRASEGKPATLRIGQEVPIPVTSFVSQFGTPGGVPTTPVTSFQYRNVGINITITPKVFVDGEIELELDFELTSQLETRTIGGIELPVFATRNVTNIVRLRDGETNLIGGLTDIVERSSVSGLPGVTDVPILNKILANNRKDSRQSDVVFSVTPHVVRAPRVSEEDLAPLPMGTEQEVKVPTLAPSIFEPPPEPEREEEAPPPPVEPPAAEPAPEAAEPAERPAAPEEQVEPAQPAQPIGPISVLFSPPEVMASVGERVELTLIAAGADSLSSGELQISFDPAGLEVAEVQPGAFLSIDGKQVAFVPIVEPGRIRVQFARQDDALGLRGSGHLVRVVFAITEAGPPRVVSATGTLRDPGGEIIPSSFTATRIVTQ